MMYWDYKLPTRDNRDMKVHYSSQRMDWKTPKAVYQVLDAEFQFDHDPCPPGYVENYNCECIPAGLSPTVCPNYIPNGLSSDWGGANFVNPPYGRELPKWIEKGFEEWQKGKTVVFLIPSRTDTRWWHDYCMKATEIRFIKGRLKFDDQKNPAPFPSAIVIFKAIA